MMTHWNELVRKIGRIRGCSTTLRTRTALARNEGGKKNARKGGLGGGGGKTPGEIGSLENGSC